MAYEFANYAPGLGNLNPAIGAGTNTPGMITTGTQSAPWTGVSPYLEEGFSEARRLYEQGGPRGYGQSTVAGFSDQTNQGLQNRQNLSSAGTPNIGIGQNLLGNTLSGDYLNNNPYLDQMYNQAASNVTRNYQEAVAPSIGANAEAQGRYGSGLYQNMMANSQRELGDSLGRLGTDIYGQNYANERARQNAAIGQVPNMAGMNYFDANQQIQTGQMYDQLSQSQLTDDYNQYTEDQLRPYKNLLGYQNSLGGNFGGTAMSQQPDYASNEGMFSAANIGSGIGIASGLMDLYSNYKALG
jgi:hypothetical protein